MGNTNGNKDPWTVTRDVPNGIGDSADDARYTIGGLGHPSAGAAFGFGEGVFPSGFSGTTITDLQVTPLSPTPGMGVNVAAGNAQLVRNGTGPYLCSSVLPQQPTFAASDPTNPRIDLVAMRMQDPGFDSGATQSWFPIVHQGTPAASPGVPASKLLDVDYPIAQVMVRANTAQILSSDITDLRQFAVSRGGIVPAVSIDTRSGSYPGQYRDKNQGLERWNGTAWIPVATGAGWSIFTPTLFYGGNGYTQVPGTTPVNMGSGAVRTARWIVSGKIMHLNYHLNFGTRPYNLGSGDICTTLPPGWTHTPNGGFSVLSATLSVAGELPNGFNPVFDGIAIIFQGANNIWPMFPGLIQSTIIQNTNFLWPGGVGYYRGASSPGQPSTGVPFIPNAFPQGGVLHITGTLEVA